MTAFLTVPTLLESCNTLPKKYENTWENPNLSPIWKALYAGATAPNPHNTQAWKFKMISEKEVLLFVDEKRILLDTDPPTRQIHIGQGCFIECFKIGASHFGYQTIVKYFPEGEYNLSEIGKKPVASLKIEAGDNSKKELFYALQMRTTNRGIYSDHKLNIEDIYNYSSKISSANAKINCIPSTHPLFSKIKNLLIDAFAIETNLRRTNEENRIWFRTNDSEIYSKKDGISLRGNGMDGLSYYFISKFFVSTKPEDWHSDFTRNAGIDAFKKQVESSGAFVYIQTPQNKMKDWILAGEKYAELNIFFNANSYAIHPMSQFLQEYPEMEKIRMEVERILEIPPKEKIQMFSRVGKSSYNFQSPRRDVKDMEI